MDISHSPPDRPSLLFRQHVVYQLILLFAHERWLDCIHPGNVHDFYRNDIGSEAWVAPRLCC